MVALPLVAVSRGRGSSGPDSGQSSPGRTLRCLFRLGEGDKRPPTATLACSWLSWRHELPTSRPSTAVSYDLTLCVICCCRCLGFFSKLQSFIGFC